VDLVDIPIIWKRKQFIIHTSYTAPPRPECIERVKAHGAVCGRCGKDDVEKNFFASISCSSDTDHIGNEGRKRSERVKL